MGIITNGNFSAATAFVAIAGITGVAETDVLTKIAHGLRNGQEVRFTARTGGTGLTVGVRYYLRDRADDTFKLAATRGGAAVDFSTDITDATLVRNGHGVPTGWTITKAGESEILAGKEEALSPSLMPIYTYAEIAVDATPGAANMTQAVVLVDGATYRLSLDARWAHQDPAQVDPVYAPTIQLRVTGEANYLLATGAWQAGANSIPIPVKVARGSRLAIVFKAVTGKTGYTILVDKGTMDGTAGFNELVRISNVRIEPYAMELLKDLPENNDTARAALPQNS